MSSFPAIQYFPSENTGISLESNDGTPLNADLEVGTVTLVLGVEGKRIFVHSVNIVYEGTYSGEGVPASLAAYELTVKGASGVYLADFSVPKPSGDDGKVSMFQSFVSDVLLADGDDLELSWYGGTPPADFATDKGVVYVVFGMVDV